MTDKSLSLTLAILLLTGCAVPGSSPASAPKPTVQIIDSAIQCSDPNRQPSVAYLRNEQQLKQMIGHLRGAVLPSPAIHLPEIDFNRWHILYISAGQKPTAGYSLALPESAFTLQQNKALLNVILNKPAPDAMVAAVITHPCILVKIPAGNYTTIEVHGLDRVHRISVKKDLSNRVK